MKTNLLTITLVLTFWSLSLSLGYMLQSYRNKVNSIKQIQGIFTQPIMAMPEKIMDTQAPQVLGVYQKSPVVSDRSYIEIKVDEELNTDAGNLQQIKFENGNYIYRHINDQLKIGPNEFKLILKDLAGNEASQEYRITRYSIGECLELSKTNIKEVQFPNALDAIVDRYHRIPDNYFPDGLVNGRNYGIPTIGSSYIRQVALDPLKKMIGDIQAQKINVAVSSGWRGFAHQQRVYNYWIGQVGAARAGDYAALPGFSEHHLGTTVDLLTEENGNSTVPQYENTKLGKWLKANAYMYGFVMSYPKGAENITTYTYEPWHYRFVGVENAFKIHELGITPIEYLYQLNDVTCE